MNPEIPEHSETDPAMEPAQQPLPAPEEVAEAAPSPGNLFADVVTGAFDATLADDKAPLPKRVLPPQPESPKLHKILAQAGLGSRLEMEQLIMEGRITVNNEPAHIGQRIQFGDQVRVNGKPIRFRIAPPPARVIAYHKPVGEVVTHDDPQNRPTVFRKLPKLQQGKWQSVGRLDLNTEGLLLFTNSGALANNLMHPRFGLEREYAVRVLGALSNEEKQKLLDGVQLDDGPAAFSSIEDGGGEGSNQWYRVTISEGRNREVRRMVEAVGHAVSRLIRIRYGAMALPRGLRRGVWLELDERDIRQLTQAAGVSAEGPRDNGRGGQGRGFDRNPQQEDARRGRRNRRNGKGRGFLGQGVGPMAPRGTESADVPFDEAPADGQTPERIPNPAPHLEEGRAPRESRGPRPQRNAGSGGQQRTPFRPPSPKSQPARGPNPHRDDNDGPIPDPMRTSMGYIGADSLSRRRGGGGMGGPSGGMGGGMGGNPGGNGQGRKSRGGKGGGGRGWGGNRRG